MKQKTVIFAALLFSAFLSALPAIAGKSAESNAQPAQSLFTKIQALDTAMFDAFNKCEDPAQLKLHATYFSPDVEFYHDTGGVTWTRDDMIVNTKNTRVETIRANLSQGLWRSTQSRILEQPQPGCIASV